MNAAFPFATSFGQRAADFFRRGVQNDGVQMPMPQPPQQQTQRNPPASKRAIRQLPTILVTSEDLVDPSNRECCICLEENHLKSRVTRLPCAHIFHQECIVDWLLKSNTCPVCRYELPTDDSNYEQIRVERMKHRKPRYARYELKRMSVRELRQVGERQRVNLSGCMEKNEMISRLIDSNRIDVIAAPEPVEYPLSLLRAMGVGELKRCMADAGVFFDPIDVVEKEDMVQIFIASGRLVVAPELGGTDTVEEPVSFVAEREREEPNGGGYQKRPVPTDDKKRSAGVPIVTTVGEDDSDEENNELAAESRIESNQLPQSNPLMEEVVFPDEATPVSSDSNASVQEDSSSRPADVEQTNNVEQNEVSEGEQQPDDVVQDTEGENYPSMMDIDTSNDLNESVEDVVMEEESDEDSIETAYPKIVGRHASTGSEDVAPRDEYASIHTDVEEDSRFKERSISDLQALARQLRVDVTDCLERSEIIARLVTAAGRSDPRPEPNDFSDWSVSELRALAREVDVDLSNCTDRISMIAALIEAANDRPRVADYLSALMPLARLTVPQLRAVGREWQVNLYDCIEKEEMIHRLVIAGGPASS